MFKTYLSNLRSGKLVFPLRRIKKKKIKSISHNLLGLRLASYFKITVQQVIEKYFGVIVDDRMHWESVDERWSGSFRQETGKHKWETVPC